MNDSKLIVFGHYDFVMIGYYPSFIATKIEHASLKNDTIIKELERTLSQIRCSCIPIESDSDNVLTTCSNGVSTSVTSNKNDWQVFLWDSEEWKFDEVETNNLQCQELSQNDELRLLDDNASATAKGSKIYKDHQMDVTHDGEYSYNRTWISASPPSLNLTCCSCGNNVTMASNLEQNWSFNNLSLNVSAYCSNLSQMIDCSASINTKLKDATCTTEVTQDGKVANHDTESNIIEQGVSLSSSNESVKLTNHPVTSSSPKQSCDESFPSETLLLFSRCNSDDRAVRNYVSSGESNCSQNHVLTYKTDAAETLMLFSPINTSEMVEQYDGRKSLKRQRLSTLNSSCITISEKENVRGTKSPSNCNIDINHEKLSIVPSPNKRFDRCNSDSKTILLLPPGSSSINSRMTHNNTKISNEDLETNQKCSNNDQNEDHVSTIRNKTLKRKLFSNIKV